MKKYKKQKRHQVWDFKRGGFKFRCTDEDALYWDILEGKCIIKYTKRTWQRALEFKEEWSQDYILCEFDCTGSSEIRVKVRRKRSHIIIYFRESKDI